MHFILAHYDYAGSALILLAFALNSLKLLKTASFWYKAMNIAGSVLLGILAFTEGLWSILALEILWTGLALCSMLNKRLGWNDQKLFPVQTSILTGIAIVIILLNMTYQADTLFYLNLLGYAGNGFVVWAYYLNLHGKVDPAGIRYHAINFIGGVFLLPAPIMEGEAAIIITAGLWAIIALFSIAKNLLRRMTFTNKERFFNNLKM